MRDRVTKILSAIFVSAALTTAAVAAESGQTRDDAALPNFHQVNQHLYRGGQPRPGDGLERLARSGIKTVINLRAADALSRAEAAEAERAGLRYFNLPLNWYRRPTAREVERVLEVINAPENWPVFLHCKRGSDRTGTIIAAYRISRDGWTARAATAEARRYGMRWIQFEMKDFIADYKLRHAASTPGTATTTTTDLFEPASHTRTHRAGVASAKTRRALRTSFVSAKKGLGKLKSVFN